MPHAATLRRQIEEALRDRVPGALTPRPVGVREVVPTGIDALDVLLRGGLPIGAITELVGPECSGRTTAALSFVASVMEAGNVCAWIDVSDALAPQSAAANGVDLERLLWVRCATGNTATPQPKLDQATPHTVTSVHEPETPARPSEPAPGGGGGSPHPRSEGRGMSSAIHQLLQSQPRSAAIRDMRRNRGVGTPGAANRPLNKAPLSVETQGKREEQIPTDRLPPRRGEHLPAVTTHQASLLQMKASLSSAMADKQAEAPREHVRSERPWSPLDRALRAADLLLQGGGFGAIVLDLGSTPAEMAWRVPLATWFRFRAASERTRVSFLLLTQHPCARSSAELVVRMQTGELQHMRSVMTGITYGAALDRQRKHRPEGNVIPIRKEPQSDTRAQWLSRAAWTRA